MSRDGIGERSYMYFNFPAHGAVVCSMDAQNLYGTQPLCLVKGQG